MSGKFIMEPRVAYLSEFLKEMSDGKIQVPRFQRELVWEWEQRRDLLCSIFEGLPIGALLIWNTRLQNIKAYESIGPFKVASQAVQSNNTYLMDGLQRMSTLYGCVYYSDYLHIDESENQVTEFQVFCDLKYDSVENLFLLKREISQKELELTSYRFLPLNLVFNSKELLRFQRNIPEEEESLIDNLELIASAFRNYKIPIVPLETDDQALVTKSFERINSRGTIMSEAHMLNALSYSENFDLLSKIDEERDIYLSSLPAWEDNLDVRFVLLLLKVRLGFDPYMKDTDLLAKQLGKTPLVMQEVFSAIQKMAVFSKECLGIENPSDFPYRLQMLGLANEFFNQEIDSERLALLKSWFWITTYTNAFGTTARNSQKCLDDLKRFSTTGKLEWTLNHQPVCRSLSKLEVSYKTARIKAWAFAMARRLDGLVNDDKTHHELLNKFKGASIIHLSKLQGIPKRPGTCFLLDPVDAKKFDITTLSPFKLELYFIDSEAMEYYRNGEFDLFAERRERLMFEWEKKSIIQPAFEAAKFETVVQYSDK